jgi:hypothetical protein
MRLESAPLHTWRFFENRELIIELGSGCRKEKSSGSNSENNGVKRLHKHKFTSDWISLCTVSENMEWILEFKEGIFLTQKRLHPTNYLQSIPF